MRIFLRQTSGRNDRISAREVENMFRPKTNAAVRLLVGHPVWFE